MPPVARLLLAAAALASVAADGSPFLAEDKSPAPEGREILYFTASWCGPCQQTEPIVLKLAKQGVKFRTIDVDLEREVATRHRVSGIPAFVAVSEGQEVDRLVGSRSEDTLRSWASRVTHFSCPVPQPGVPPEVPGATRIEPLLRVTYPVPKEKAEALIAFLKEHSKAEFDSDVEANSLRITAAPEVQQALGPFLRDVLTVKEPSEPSAEEDL